MPRVLGAGCCSPRWGVESGRLLKSFGFLLQRVGRVVCGVMELLCVSGWRGAVCRHGDPRGLSTASKISAAAAAWGVELQRDAHPPPTAAMVCVPNSQHQNSLHTTLVSGAPYSKDDLAVPWALEVWACTGWSNRTLNDRPVYPT